MELSKWREKEERRGWSRIPEMAGDRKVRVQRKIDSISRMELGVALGN